MSKFDKPIDRGEFLRARMAYLASMHEEGDSFEEMRRAINLGEGDDEQIVLLLQQWAEGPGIRVRKVSDEIIWKQECPHGGVKYYENFNDYADPDGCHTYELWVAAMNRTGLPPCDKWSWEVDWPDGHASGETKTQEEARAMAVKVYNAIKAT